MADIDPAFMKQVFDVSQRERMLEEAGAIFRDRRSTIPPELTYGLTKRGDELGSVLDDLEVIARRWDL